MSTIADPSALSERRIAVWLWLLTLIVYAWFFGGGGWNQNAHFALTRAMVEEQKFEIDSFRATTGDIAESDGHVYANKAPGLSMMAALPYALLSVLQGETELDSFAAQTLNQYLCTVAIVAMPAALIPPFLFLYGRRVLQLSRTRALAVALILAFCSPLFPYATVFLLHAPSAALLLIGFLCSQRDNLKGPVLAGLCLGLATTTNYLGAPAVIIVALLIGKLQRATRPVLIFLASSLPGLILLAWYQFAAWGSLSRVPVSMNPSFRTEGAFLGLLQLPQWEALWGITLSPYRGLFYLSPVLILAVGGWIVWWRSRERRAELLAATAIIAVFIVFNLTFNQWEGGSSIGPRYLVPIVPLLGLMMFRLVGVWKPLWLVLTTVAFLNVFAATAVNPLPPRPIADPLGDYIYPLLITGNIPDRIPINPPSLRQHLGGHVSTNRHAVDEYLPFSKHRPGSNESEWASFNLGETFAPRSLASLVPVFLMLLTGAGLLFRIAREP